MFEPGPNDTLSQNFMKLGLLVAEENVDRQTDTHTDRQDSCFISIDYEHTMDNGDTFCFNNIDRVSQDATTHDRGVTGTGLVTFSGDTVTTIGRSAETFDTKLESCISVVCLCGWVGVKSKEERDRGGESENKLYRESGREKKAGKWR